MSLAKIVRWFIKKPDPAIISARVRPRPSDSQERIALALEKLDQESEIYQKKVLDCTARITNKLKNNPDESQTFPQ